MFDFALVINVICGIRSNKMTVCNENILGNDLVLASNTASRLIVDINEKRVAMMPTLSLLGYYHYTWWRHQMETFSALLALCAGNSPVTGEFPAQRAVTQSFDVFFDLRLNKRLSKQSSGWWFETRSCSLWCHCNKLLDFTCWLHGRLCGVYYEHLANIDLVRHELWLYLSCDLLNSLW